MASDRAVPEPPQILLDAFFAPPHAPAGLALHTGDGAQPTPLPRGDARPFVTLTFAQSLDGKIAGTGGKQLALSGKESLVMTHWMRTMHDAILVGIGTALNDDPQLNTRHVPPLPAGHPHTYHLPRPVVLDTRLRLRTDCKLLVNFAQGRGRRPWVVGTRPAEGDRAAWEARRAALQNAGARVIEVEGTNGRVAIPALLQALRDLGIRSLMVEGGARIIQSFLAESKEETASRVVDAVIVTVAPTFVGDDGVGYGGNLSSAAVKHLEHSRTELFGRDVVFSMKFTS